LAFTTQSFNHRAKLKAFVGVAFRGCYQEKCTKTDSWCLIADKGSLSLQPHPSYPFSKGEGTALHTIFKHLFFQIIICSLINMEPASFFYYNCIVKAGLPAWIFWGCGLQTFFQL
jgi:hypothetical protein